VYGTELGEGFIECHHRSPLSELDKPTKTTLDDLALVCSNCHSMLHRSGCNLTVEQLADVLARNGGHSKQLRIPESK
jgi:5-methylcytosine-specific restriction enzyme A